MPFRSTLPSREEWENLTAIIASTIALYSYGSKMDEGTGARIYSEALEGRRLHDCSSVFQVEVLAVKESAKLISVLAIPPVDIATLTYSQEATRAISATEKKIGLGLSCCEELQALGSQHRINLCWVPGHSNIPGNEEADRLAREGSGLSLKQAIAHHQPASLGR